MIREIIATGRDVNAAIDQGCVELGIEREDAQFEIIALPKKGFLGLKNYPAKVRVFQELPDIEIKRPTPAPKPRVEQPKAAQPAPRAESRPAPTPAPRPEAAKPQPVKNDQPRVEARPAPAPRQAVPSAQPAPRVDSRPAPRPRPEPRPSNDDHAEPAPQVEITPTEEVRGKVEKAAVYLADIMRAMGFEGIEVTPRYYSEAVCLQLSGAQMGVVIGRRGETLDALQYLTSLIANRGEGDYIRINIDSGNYREKREKTLTALARKLALQAVRTGKSTTLEPMNPYERRVIHGAVSQIRGAVSNSVGADPNRRVVIGCEDPSKVRGPRPEGDRAPRPMGDRRPPRPMGDRPPRPEGDRVPAPRTEGDRVPAPHPEGDRVARPMGDRPAPRPTGDRPPRPMGDRGPRRDGDRRPPRRDDRPAPVVADPSAPPREKLSDAALFADVPIGVPLVHGQRVEKPVKEPVAKPEPRKLDDAGEGAPRLYGKID